MGFSAIFCIKEIQVFFFCFFFITSRVLNVVLMVSTVHEHGFVQSRHPGCSFWRMLSASEMLEALRGLGSFANHRSKNMAFFFFCSLKHCKQSPVQQNRTVVKTTQHRGKSKHCWLERCGNIALVHWWYVCKKKKKRTEVHFLINGSEAGNEQRWWSHGRKGLWVSGECHRCCWKAWAEISQKCLYAKSIFVLLVYSGAKVGLVKRHFFWKTMKKKDVSFSAHLCVCVFCFFSEEV